MRLPVPGPRSVLSVLERSADSVEQLIGAVPRLLSVLDAAELMLGRVNGLIDRIDMTRASADEVVARTDAAVVQAEEMLARTTLLVDRLVPLLDRMEPSLVQLQPTLERLAETTDPREIDAFVTLIDLLPDLTLKMETIVVPVLGSLSSVAPDLHDLLDVSRELNEMLGSVPGLGRIKRRVDEEQLADGRGQPPSAF